MAELDIFQDTTADVAFADTTAMAAEEQTERMYDYTNQRESGGSQNLYWGNSSRQVTAAELQELYNADDNARLREAFKTFDNYLAYMNERQDLIDSGEYKADWWNTGVPLVSEETLADPEAGMDDRAFERQVIEEGARQGEIGYNEQADVFQSLYEKYTGESTTKYLDNGAKYEWNGTSFVLTQEAFGPSWGSILGEALPSIVISAGLNSAGIIDALAGGITTATNGAITGAAATGAAAGVINSATQAALTGDVDFKQALVAAGTAAFGEAFGSTVEDLEMPENINTVIEGVDIPTGIEMLEEATGTAVNSDVLAQIIDAAGPVAAGVIYGSAGEAGGTTGGVKTDEEGNILVDENGNLVFEDINVGIILNDILNAVVDDEAGGGGATGAEDSSVDADNDGVPASQDPDDNNPNVPVSGGIINETGEEVTTDGEKVEGDGSQVGSEYSWKYLGDGCFVQVDQNGQELPNTKVCDPDYTEADYEFYEVGGMYGSGTDKPFGTPEGDEGVTTEAEPRPAGTDLGYECLPNGDKVVYTADGKGGATTEVIPGGCLEDQDSGGITVVPPVSDGGGATDSGVSTTGGTADSGEAAGDAAGDAGAGTEGTGKDGAGDDGTGEGKGGDGKGKGEDGEKQAPEESSLFGMAGYKPTPPVGIGYELPEIPSVIQTFQTDWTSSLSELEDRIQKRNPSLFDGMV